MLRALCLSLAVAFGPGAAVPVLAQAAPPVALRTDTLALFEAVGMEESFDIIAEAGIRDALSLEEDLFPGRGGASWAALVDRLVTPDLLRETFTRAFPESRLGEAQMTEILAFFTSETGRRIIEGELAAWRAITDPEIEEAANAVYFRRLAEGDPRIDLLTRLIESNDFVDLNVMGGLNANVAFLQGLSDGGAYEQDVSEEMILSQAWQQEPRLREDTTLWLYSYQLMAYSSLTDADLQAYIAFCESEAGQAYNAALFTGFDAIFTDMSYRLGATAAGFMTGAPL